MAFFTAAASTPRSTIPCPNATYARGINDAGQIVGLYEDSSGTQHGFLYSGGKYTTIDDPLGTVDTAAFGINDAGQIAGYYQDSSGQHGFLAIPVTTPPNATTITLPSSSTGDLGTIGGNGPTVIDASMTNGVTFSVGNGPITIVAGAGDVIQAGNGPETTG
jgi:probable HAF family extracellular repeat protein